MALKRRIGAEHSATRAIILDTTEQLMLEEGYAAVSTRRVAGKAGLKAPLVHYYFHTTDDLLLAVFRRAADQSLERLTEALASENPLRTLWTLSTDPSRTALALEFMALANHRKVIRAEIALSVERTRTVQAEALSRILDGKAIDPNICPPIGASLLIAGISRALVMEEGLGISSGHAEAKAFVEWCLRRLEETLRPAKAAPARAIARKKIPSPQRGEG